MGFANKCFALFLLTSLSKEITGNTTEYDRRLQISSKVARVERDGVVVAGTEGRKWRTREQQAPLRPKHDIRTDTPPPPIGKASLLHHTTLVVIADVGSEDTLRAAQCTYMSTLDPYQIIYISDFSIPRPGGCNLPIIHTLRIPFATDYFDALKELYVSKIPLHPWVLIVRPWTFVHPARVTSYLNERGVLSKEVYVGRLRNSTTELSALAQMPHVAYEYGILIRSWGCLLVGQDRGEYRGYMNLMKNDFHTIEAGVADIAATLFASENMIVPVRRDNLFVAAFPGMTSKSLNREKKDSFLTLGPIMTPDEMFELARDFQLLDQPFVASDSTARRLGISQSSTQFSSPGSSLSAPYHRNSMSIVSFPVNSSASMEIDSHNKNNFGRIAARKRAELKSQQTSEERVLNELSLNQNLPIPVGYEKRVKMFNDQRSSVPPPPRIMFAVLAREDSLVEVVHDALNTWGKIVLDRQNKRSSQGGASILFFYSQTDINALSSEDDTEFRKGMSGVKRYLFDVYQNSSRRLEADSDLESSDFDLKRERELTMFSRSVIKEKTKHLPEPRVSSHSKSSKSSPSSTPSHPSSTPSHPSSTPSHPSSTPSHPSSTPSHPSSTSSSKSSHSSSSSSKSSPHVNQHSYHAKEFEHKYIYGSPYKCLVSENLSPRVPLPGEDELNTQMRLIGLYLPPSPKASSDFYKKSLSKPMGWHLWLRAKVSGIIGFLTHFKPTIRDPGLDMSRYGWFVVVDDDTYVKVPQFITALGTRGFHSERSIALGRKFFFPGKGSLLGGGPGVALSRGALDRIKQVDCMKQDFPIISHSVPGGDGWLGQCMSLAQVVMMNDWRFKSLPPYSYSPNQQAHAISFHKSHVAQVEAYLEKQSRSALPLADPTCNPIIIRDQAQTFCLPQFTIIGAQKAGTTSMFSYLGQHEQVKLPSEKELNFWGNPWPISFHQRHLTSLSSFTFSYLKRFKLRDAANKKLDTIYGEASPDYFISTRSVLPNILRYAPSMKIVVSLRDPIERFVSAYKNKVADGTVHKHIDKHLYHGKTDKRKDKDIPDYVVPSMVALVYDMEITLGKCPDQSKHYTLAEKPPKNKDNSGDECYVIPFILHGYYAKYLQPWINSYGGEAHNLMIIDFSEFEAQGQKVMSELAQFLHIRPMQFKVGSVFNSRSNRGVHSKAHATGGAVSAISKSQVSLDSWTSELPEATYKSLFKYYEEPNRQLAVLLKEENVTMTWLDKALEKSAGQ